MRSLLSACVLLAATATAGAAPHGVVSTDTFELAQEAYNIALDVKLASHIALRGELVDDERQDFMRDAPYDGQDYYGGSQAAVAFRTFLFGVFDGPYADAEIRTRSFTLLDYGPGSEGVTWRDGYLAWSPRLFVGYQRVFGKLSLQAAVGIGYEWATREDGGWAMEQTLYMGSLRAGYAW